jgi:hypothetical protein
MSVGRVEGLGLSAGEAKGQVTLQSSGFLEPSVALKSHPEIRARLDDIAKQGWKYLFVTIVGTVTAEVVLDESAFRVSYRSFDRGPRGERLNPKFFLELDLGPQMPAPSTKPELSEFSVNVCSKTFPRAASVDLLKGTVTYLDDRFWKWELGWEADPKKLSDAREIYKIATWLLDVKGYKLTEAFKLERYQELSKQFKDMPT